jgi:hypothetical protein
MSGAVVTAGSTKGTTTITAQSGLRPGISSTWISVCNSVVVVNGSAFAASIANADCFTAFDQDRLYLPTSFKRGDLYRVTLAPGQTVVFTTDTGSNGLDTFIVVADRLGNVLAENDDFGSGLGSRVSYTNNTGVSGVAIVQVTTYDDLRTGSYAVTVSVTP